MGKGLKRALIGRPLKNEAIEGEKYGVLWGLPILASDAVSSVAYAGQEILLVLVPLVGLAAYGKLTIISAAVIGLLALVVFSYRQTIQSYPSGGGAYIVAKENIGILAGVTAGAALSIDYVLTVAVSISSGIDAVTTAIVQLQEFKIPICILMVLLLTIGNLRGIRESSKMFSFPTYAFIFSISAMIITGFYNYFTGNVNAIQHTETVVKTVAPVTLFLMLRAFSNGCSALTGVEAVSNAVPNFKEPSPKNANKVLLILAFLVLALFGGTSILANIYQVEPSVDKSLLVQMASSIFTQGSIMYFIIAATTFIILVLAANTAFSGFPMLVSVMAREGHVPRQLSMRGDRLSYSNGIILLSVFASVLIIIFQANVTSLIGLYAIGVFISFTLSQSGMFMRLIRRKEESWLFKSMLSGFGALVTSVVVIIIAITKFNEGAWIVVFLIPILSVLMVKTKKHYVAVSKQLRLSLEELASVDLSKDVYRNRVIVPIESVNKASVRALRYARTISDNVVAFTVFIDEESGNKLKERYSKLNTDIPLIIKYSPFRKVIDPLLKFIESAEYDYKKGDMITVILPQFEVRVWWNKLLHNRTRVFIEKKLMKHKHIVVSIMPLQLKDDEFVLKSPRYK